MTHFRRLEPVQRGGCVEESCVKSFGPLCLELRLILVKAEVNIQTVENLFVKRCYEIVIKRYSVLEIILRDYCM